MSNSSPSMLAMPNAAFQAMLYNYVAVRFNASPSSRLNRILFWCRPVSNVFVFDFFRITGRVFDREHFNTSFPSDRRDVIANWALMYLNEQSKLTEGR